MIETLKKAASSLERIAKAVELEAEWRELMSLIEETSDGAVESYNRLLADFMSEQQDLFNELGNAPKENDALKNYLDLGSLGKLPAAMRLSNLLKTFKREFKKVVKIYGDSM